MHLHHQTRRLEIGFIQKVDLVKNGLTKGPSLSSLFSRRVN